MTLTADRNEKTTLYPTGDELINITHALEEHAREHPHALAIVYPHGRDEQGRVSYTHYTYRQLLEASNQIAAGLEQIGITRGMHTVLLVTPSLDFFALAFAMFRAGVVPVIIDPGIDRAALKECIAEAEPEAFIGVPRAHVGRLIFGWGRETIKHLVTVGRRALWGGHTLEEVREMGAGITYDAPDTRADELAAIVFTSGSTGIPKGVQYTHGNFVASATMLREELGIQPGEVDLPTFPMFALFDPVLGMTTIIPDMDSTRPAEVDPAKIIEPVENFGVTMMFGSPALLNTVSRYGEKHGSMLKTVKRVASAGAPVPAEVIERMHGMLTEDAVIWSAYGATESLPVAFNTSPVILGETRYKTMEGAGVCIGEPVERALVRVIRITDEPIPEWGDELVVPTGEVGEITVVSPSTTLSYYGRERATEKAKIRGPQGETIHRMGDLGYFDEEGRLWYCGRKGHRVETTAGPLFTIMVEQVFNTHPKVYRTALVGVGPHKSRTPVLLIELEKAHHNADHEQVIKELREIGQQYVHTALVQTFLVHPGFPVDIRHNSKIFREKLAPWAAKQLGVPESHG